MNRTDQEVAEVAEKKLRLEMARRVWEIKLVVKDALEVARLCPSGLSTMCLNAQTQERDAEREMERCRAEWLRAIGCEPKAEVTP